ncbi:MAG: protein translocase subunit SecD, partial [Desulfobacterales bacterium]|nr:protein translocase subunit SecD [Desulfobacterales bacterium]
MKNISWRWIVVLAVIAVAIVYTLPTFNPGLWPHKKINLGLDLQGGMHLVLEVDAEKTVESAIDRIHQDLRGFMRKEHIAYTRVERLKAAEITVHIPEDQLEKFEDLLDKQFRELRLASKSSDNGVVAMRFDLPEAETEHIKTMAVDQALETIRNRIDEFGVSEPDIR